MKKLFTLIAFLAVVMGAKAEWVKVYSIDYSSNTGFPFYVMGYVPEWVDGVMTDYGSMFKYEPAGYEVKDGESIEGQVKTQSDVEYDKVSLTTAGWHQYFIADGITTELDGAYTVKAMVKASEACTINVNMGWGWGEGQQASAQVSIGTEWAEVEWDYTGIQGQNCNLVAQPGGQTAKIEWKTVEVWQNKKQSSRPQVWENLLVDENGEYVDGVVNQLAKPLEMQLDPNTTDDDIYAIVKPSLSKVENGEKVYYFESPAVDKDAYSAAADQNSFAWANQLFITSPVAMKPGAKVKISFDYKADKNAATDTQAHGRPSAYHHWDMLGEISFTTEWQHAEKEITVSADQGKNGGMYSLAFNLNKAFFEANTWYLKNMKFEKLVLDEGFFVSSANVANGIAHDYDTAPELVYDEAEDAFVAVVGEMGKKETWVNELMISTLRGEDQSFKANTIKPAYVKNDAEDWAAYQPSTNYKIKLPAAGVWQISIADVKEDGTGLINFVKLEGEEEKEPVVIVANPTEVIINAVEREYTAAEAPEGYEFAKNDEGKDITGQPWDNQFCIMANRPIKSGEETVISFDYVAEKAAKANTQVTSDVPGGYLFWNCIGDVEFTTEEQHLEKAYKIPLGDQNAELTTQSITFNMAVIKDANVYRIKNIIWKTADDSESLIDMEGTKNFFVKTGANTGFFEAGTDGIEEIVVDKATSNAIYNLAGQRVSKSFKGVAIKNGQKFIVK